MFQRLPPLNAIRAFEAAARLNSFKDAANELNVTPTAISHQIRGLEDKLKIRLFERKTRSVVLTHEGELLAATANKSLHDLLHTVNQLTSSPNTLTISTTNSFAAMWLVPHLSDFQQQHQEIEIIIRAEESLIDIEYDRRVDMVIRYGEPPHAQAGTEVLIQEKLACFATAEYWEKHYKNPSDSVFYCTQWKNQNLPSLAIETLLPSLLSSVSSPAIRYFNDENQTVQAALSGQGIGVMSQLAVETSVTNGWLVPGKLDMAKEFSGLHYYLVIPTRQQTNPAVVQFKNWLLQALAKC
ncbi:LysR substrate-binding domain-containing protein [Agarivorans sp. QJM3NY_29]|uniref:LysR substrate-binding domain-containing protein n=1 Tax=unclassified Agarivorans TaxID=2636026 RepID=UPI003D7D33AB